MLTRAPGGLPPIVQSEERLLVCIELAECGLGKEPSLSLTLRATFVCPNMFQHCRAD